jgi:hypothetical protein
MAQARLVDGNIEMHLLFDYFLWNGFCGMKGQTGDRANTRLG